MRIISDGMNRRFNTRCGLVIILAVALLLIIGGGSMANASEIGHKDMVFVEGGTFAMGDDRYDDAKPIRQVTVRSFYIGKYEVTADEYDAFCLVTKRNLLQRGNRPAVRVSWDDAIEYCNWRSIQEGLTPVYRGRVDNRANGYRLPTEAEWEYAAKGGKASQGFTYSGGDILKMVAWYRDNSYQDNPVGQKDPNELGIYDMSGNVLEWCWDLYDKDYYQRGDNDNPLGPSQGRDHVYRGGSYATPENYMSPSARDHTYPAQYYPNLGFRLVRTAP